VATLLYHARAPDEVIAAGLLHDVIEKTSVDAARLRRRFGARVAAIVLAVSEDQTMSGYQARKSALRHQVACAGEEALTVFAADKVSKARELRLAPPRPRGPRNQSRGRRARQRKLTHYQHSLALLEQLLPDSPLVMQLRAELDRLTATHAGPAMVAGAA
jgi:(p)ppGpp synthase/HD superfamily hydrolase